MDTSKLLNDPQFETKLVDVVGLYLNPPEQAIVLCMHEKSQIQALDRTQPSLPIKPGRAGTMTHDYKRNGTTTLFAALEVATGKMIGQCLPKHRHEEFLKFLKTIERNVPAELQIHLILDNYASILVSKVRSLQQTQGASGSQGSICRERRARRDRRREVACLNRGRCEAPWP